MKFEEWYYKTWPEAEGKTDGIHLACKSAAAFSWEACEKATVERILEMLDECGYESMEKSESLCGKCLWISNRHNEIINEFLKEREG